MEFYFWFFVVLNFIEDNIFGLSLLLISLTSLMFVFGLLYRIRQLKSENLKLRESIKTLLEAEINFDDCEGRGEGKVLVNPPITITNNLSEELHISKIIADGFYKKLDELDEQTFKQLLK